MRQLQRLGVFDEDAVLRCHAGTGHDGGRCGQPQGAGAGNHQHGHGTHQRHFSARTGPQPAQQGQQGHQQHHRHEHRRHLVHQTLDGRLGRLGVFHQANDARQQRLRPHSLHLHDDAAFTIDGTARQLAARLTQHRQRLAGEHGLIHMGAALQQQTIEGDALARAYHQAVAHHDFVQRHIHLAIAREQVGAVGAQRVQGADGGGGLALGARFQPFAQQHQGDDHGRGLEVQVGRVPRRCAPPQPQRQAIARTGAQGHEQVHVARERARRVPARLVKARAQVKLHRRGQEPLQPGRQHPVLAQRIAQHGQHQRGRQRQPQRHRRKPGPWPRLGLRGGHGAVQARLIARIAHGTLQALGHVRGAVCRRLGRQRVGDVRRLRRQVHRHLLHTRHLAQRPLYTGHTTGAGHPAHPHIQHRAGGHAGSFVVCHGNTSAKNPNKQGPTTTPQAQLRR